jgi:hypothetical protein
MEKAITPKPCPDRARPPARSALATHPQTLVYADTGVVSQQKESFTACNACARLRASGWGTAKGRSQVARKLRPYERNRCAEHGVTTGKSAVEERSVPAPPVVVMLSPQTLLSNASMAQI